MAHIHDYLAAVAESGGSDLHLKVGGPAYIRIDGDLKPVATLPPLSQNDTASFAKDLMAPPDSEGKRSDTDLLRTFNKRGDVDFAYSLPGVGRFRVNAFRQRGSIGLVMRRVLPGKETIESLGLPEAITKLASQHRGLILVTGPTGAGKTTTTAAMLRHVNASRRCHIVTLEDPIEVVHSDDHAIIDQREVGVDTESFASGLKAVSRQDPDVIFIGEMRDLETITAALQAAETGHLVISTLHTTDAKETVNRIVDMYPKEQQNQARLALANSLQGIVCQRLVQRSSGEGRVAAIEVLVNTKRVKEFLMDPSKLDLIVDAINEGSFSGMQSFDEHLLQLFLNEEITLRDALQSATNPEDFKVTLRSARAPSEPTS